MTSRKTQRNSTIDLKGRVFYSLGRRPTQSQIGDWLWEWLRLYNKQNVRQRSFERNVSLPQTLPTYLPLQACSNSTRSSMLYTIPCYNIINQWRASNQSVTSTWSQQTFCYFIYLWACHIPGHDQKMADKITGLYGI